MSIYELIYFYSVVYHNKWHRNVLHTSFGLLSTICSRIRVVDGNRTYNFLCFCFFYTLLCDLFFPTTLTDWIVDIKNGFVYFYLVCCLGITLKLDVFMNQWMNEFLFNYGFCLGSSFNLEDYKRRYGRKIWHLLWI
jgi:hypothetical protein